MRVLIIEDEDGLASALRIGLTHEGYAVDVALSCAAGRTQLAVAEYDLLILDVNLPDGDGFALAEAIRNGGTPCMSGSELRILMLTARGQLQDRVRGLDVGADDYLVKPFALTELSARVRALLRREVSGSTSVLSVGPVRVDTARQIAHRDDRELRLTRKEFGILRYLIARRGAVVSAEELLEHVWNSDADPFSQTVRVTVGTLRRKLTVDGEEPVLETLVGRGYRLRDLPALEGEKTRS